MPINKLRVTLFSWFKKKVLSSPMFLISLEDIDPYDGQSNE